MLKFTWKTTISNKKRKRISLLTNLKIKIIDLIFVLDYMDFAKNVNANYRKHILFVMNIN